MSELLERIRALPDSPGVYQYLDENGRLLYVGKAKSLKNRVKSYFSFTPSLQPDSRLSPRIFKMISETRQLEYIVVNRENDALILENSLIKQLKPKYNILLRDDKTYPYIYIDLSQDFPRFEITRKIVRGKGIKYFGPFASGGRDILDALYEIFPLVQKKNCIKGKKACLFYQIGRCKAPCEGLITPEAYRALIDEAIHVINHKQKIVKTLEAKMLHYAENEHFEEAAKLRDQVANIKTSTVQSGVDLAKSEHFDVIALADANNQAVAVRLFIREGRVISSAHQSFRFSQGYDEDEAYERAFLSFYGPDMPVTATTVYTGRDFADRAAIEAWLNETFDRRFEISVPQRGPKKEIVDLARKNAEELLKKEANKPAIEAEAQALLSLENPPVRVETFDNSHLMGQATVGAMVVWDEGRFVRADFRHYNLEARDEYGQMKEMLSRRAEKFAENPPPDCWVIDGGETLRRLAADVLQSVGVKIDVVAIAKEKLDAKAHRAKGSARDLLYANGEVYTLEPTDRRLQFFQRLRDEAHRFAIEFHRKQKRRADSQLLILKTKGIGDATLKRLLDVFGTFEAIEKASYDEVKAAAGEKAARALKERNE